MQVIPLSFTDNWCPLSIYYGLISFRGSYWGDTGTSEVNHLIIHVKLSNEEASTISNGSVPWITDAVGLGPRQSCWPGPAAHKSKKHAFPQVAHLSWMTVLSNSWELREQRERHGSGTGAERSNPIFHPECLCFLPETEATGSHYLIKSQSAEQGHIT